MAGGPGTAYSLVSAEAGYPAGTKAGYSALELDSRLMILST